MTKKDLKMFGVKTLADMSEEEIQALEKQYNTKIDRDRIKKTRRRRPYSMSKGNWATATKNKNA